MIFILVPLLAGNLLAQPAVEWDKLQTLSPGFGPYARVASPTMDGGLIVGLYPVSNVGSAYNIIKLDSKGNKEWGKIFGGNKDDELQTITQTMDGGYIVGGYSDSDAGGDKTDSSNYSDYWIIKITADGTKQWDKTYGGTGSDQLEALIQTSDGGYLLGGSSGSPANGIKTENPYGEGDIWVIKIDANGTKEWDKTLGGSEYDYGPTFAETTDGDYIVCGESRSGVSGNRTAGSKGENDYWVVKLSADGSKLWDKAYGGRFFDRRPIITRTPDNGYLLAGESSSGVGGDKTDPNFGYSDLWIVKINSEGEMQWEESFGGKENDWIKSIEPTPDGGYLIGGMGGTFLSPELPGYGFWVFKIDADGSKLWERNIPGGYDQLAGAFPTADGGYLLTGHALSDNAEGNKTEFGQGIWTVKLLAESNDKKLAFSADSLNFVLSSIPTDSSRNVNLSANTGTPEVTLRKSAADWLDLPSPALGSLPFTVTTAGIASNQYSSIVAATAPGYARALLKVNLKVKEVTNPPVLSPIGDKELLQGGTLKFVAAASAGNGQIKVFSLLNAPTGAAIDAVTGAFNWVAPWEAGTYQFTVRVSIVGFPNLYDEETIEVKVVEPINYPAIRINAGGKDFTTADGRVFMADTFFVGDTRTSTVEDVDIVNTPDDELYRSSRCDFFFNYRIPVQPGIYKVTLHFAEVFWGVYPGKPGNASSRLFDVRAEREMKLLTYSILQKAGGPLRAVIETFEISVLDGFLDLEFNYTDADRPKVAAIEVEATKPLSELSLGPVADAYVRYGSSAQTNYGFEQTVDVKATNKAELERTAYIKFSLASLSEIRSAKFRIYGQNYQFYKPVQVSLSGIDNDNWSETGITASNAPTGPSTFLGSFPVRHNEQFFEVDITEFAKEQLAQDKILTVMLADLFTGNRRITFNSRENAVNPPELIIVTSGPVIQTARLAQTEVLTEAANKTENELTASIIYPNPVQKHFTVQIGNQHRDNISLQLINAAGQSYPVKTNEELYAGSKAEADISGLSLTSGIYLLKIKSEAATEVIKLLVSQ